MDAIVGPILKFLVEPIKKQVGYLTFYNRNVKKFKDEIAKLNGVNIALQPSLAAALENGETIMEDVLNWQSQVDAINKKAATFPPRCWNMSRYRLSRRAKKMTQDDLSELRRTCEPFKRGPISLYLSSGWPQPNGTGESSTSAESNEISFIVNDVLDTFLEDDQMYMIGIHGKDLLHMNRLVDTIFIKATGKFQYGATAAAKKHDKKDIQDEIAFGLGMTKFSRQDTDPVRRHRLSNRLKDKTKKLILLDDAREILDLEAIGIPFGEGEWNKTCKIIVTSSDKSICEKMKTQMNYKLEVHQQMLLFGGHITGDLWDDKAHTTIRSITVTHNKTGICSFQTEYDDNGHSSVSLNHHFLRNSAQEAEKKKRISSGCRSVTSAYGAHLSTRTVSVLNPKKKINLKHPQEFLISVSGYLLKSETNNHDVLHSLTFKSNKQTFGPFGGPKTEAGLFFTSTTKARKIIGFYGRKNSDNYLGSLGYYYEEPISDIGVSDGSSENITLFQEGGTGGGPWNDGSVHTTVRLIKLQVGHENVLTGLAVKYDNNDGSSEWHAHGDKSFYTSMMELHPGEFLISMSGTTRNLYGWVVISSLEFQSNNNRTFGPFGDTNGDPFSSSPTHSGKIVGFFGKIGAHLDSIGAYFQTSSNL